MKRRTMSTPMAQTLMLASWLLNFRVFLHSMLICSWQNQFLFGNVFIIFQSLRFSCNCFCNRLNTKFFSLFFAWVYSSSLSSLLSAYLFTKFSLRRLFLLAAKGLSVLLVAMALQIFGETLCCSVVVEAKPFFQADNLAC